jgi:hypothetical protein
MGRYAKNARKKYFIKETCVIMAPLRGFGFKNRNFGGFFSGKEVKNLQNFYPILTE